MENRNQLLKDSFGGCLAGFGIAEGYLAGVDRSGRGFNPRPAQDRPTQPRPAQDRLAQDRPTQGRRGILIAGGFAG